MRLKKVLSILLSGAMCFSVMTAYASGTEVATNNQLNLMVAEVTEVAIDLSNYDASYDPKADITAELLEKLESYDPRASVDRDMETGEVTIEDYVMPISHRYNANNVYGTDPYFPGELEEPIMNSSRSIIGTDNRKQLTNEM